MHRNGTTGNYKHNVRTVAATGAVWLASASLIVSSLVTNEARFSRAGTFLAIIGSLLILDLMLKRERARVETIADLVQLAQRVGGDDPDGGRRPRVVGMHEQRRSVG